MGAAARKACSRALLARASDTYARHSREALEEKWILDNLPLVRHIVEKVAGNLSHGVDREDLISAGTLGLVKAARAFDPGREAEFRTYAYIRIRGAVTDELRGRSFVPSNVVSQIRAVRKAYHRYVDAHGEAPSDEQLAAEVGISTARLYRVLQEARKQSFLSIHGLSEERPALGGLVPRDPSPDPYRQLERKEMLERLARSLEELPERDRLILLLYYERDLTMNEISKVLEITESRVSQLHASALFKLSMKLRA